DHIDNSIIQLLAEDIPVEELDQEVSSLIQNTLTYYQSDDNLKARLSELFQLRSEKLKPIVVSGNLNLIKNTGIPLRSFDSIEKLIDYDQDFLAEVDNVLDDQWVNFMFDILFEIDDFKESIV